MSSRSKRKLEHFDPNASDPEDLDWDAADGPAPQRRRKRTQGSHKKSSKRSRQGYSGSDVDDDDEILDDDSFTDRSSSEEVEINPSTGRSVRRTAKKQITYEESEEDEIEDSSSEDELKPTPHRDRPERTHKSIETPSLIVKLKVDMADHPSGRNLRTRQGSKSIARPQSPEARGTRRSSRLSHDFEDTIIELSESGKHANIVRQGTRSPEPVIARATRGGKGPRAPQHSAIMEASQETSMRRGESADPEPADAMLAEENETQVQDSNAGSFEQEAQVSKVEEQDEDEEDMGVIQESQHEGGGEDSEEEEEGPITRGGRDRRVSWSAARYAQLTSPDPSEIGEKQRRRREQ